MNFDEGHDGKPCCSFCGKREGQVKRLISGRGVFILSLIHISEPTRH